MTSGERGPGLERSDSDDLRAGLARARAFVTADVGFAQVTTTGRGGYQVLHTMTAFLEPDCSVSLVQRGTHRRIAQWAKDPRTLVVWIGSPASGASNESPLVFDIGGLPPQGLR